MTYRRIAALKTAEAFRQYVAGLGIDLPFDEAVSTGPDAPLAQPYYLPEGAAGSSRALGNRFAVLPMEGWDGTPEGLPSELTVRRWQRFGESGAKFIWGGEATAVRHDGRANPNQLVINEATLPALAALRQTLIDAHAARWRTDDLLIGLQLTHSGRFSRPVDKKRLAPSILYHHPLLDRKFGVPADYPVMTDDEIKRLIDDFVTAACLAQRAGFDFVDVKHCHGYLGHEFLSAVDRPGPYGGSLENRMRFLREVTAGIRAAAPGLGIGVRLSAFDFIPFRAGASGCGEPEPWAAGRYPYAFGGDGSGVGIDLTEPLAFVD
jgi:NADPH2 dehydrogenase